MARLFGGSSLDNSVLIHDVVPTNWIFCDVHPTALKGGDVSAI